MDRSELKKHIVGPDSHGPDAIRRQLRRGLRQDAGRGGVVGRAGTRDWQGGGQGGRRDGRGAAAPRQRVAGAPQDRGGRDRREGVGGVRHPLQGHRADHRGRPARAGPGSDRAPDIAAHLQRPKAGRHPAVLRGGLRRYRHRHPDLQHPLADVREHRGGNFREDGGLRARGRHQVAPERAGGIRGDISSWRTSSTSSTTTRRRCSVTSWAARGSST